MGLSPPDSYPLMCSLVCGIAFPALQCIPIQMCFVASQRRPLTASVPRPLAWAFKINASASLVSYVFRIRWTVFVCRGFQDTLQVKVSKNYSALDLNREHEG